MMRIVCTDRGQHSERKLDTIVRQPSSAVTAAGGLVSTHHKPGTSVLEAASVQPMPYPGDAPGLNKHSWTFRCDSCHRGETINQDKMVRLYEISQRAGGKPLDVSYRRELFKLLRLNEDSPVSDSDLAKFFDGIRRAGSRPQGSADLE